jgi:hypothetical protein
MNTNSTFRDITGLTKFLKILLWAGATWALVSLFSGWLQFELLSRGSFSQSEGQANDSRQQIIGLVYLLLYIVTVIIFARWILRANHNVRALGAQDMRFTPGWAVGYFFVPIVCLWRPYQAMKDLWRASKNPAAWQDIQPGSILGLWWTLWIVSNILGQASFRASMAARDASSLQAATIIDMASDVSHIALCIAAITLISQIRESQINQQAPNKSPEPTPVGAVSSAIAVHVVSRRWLSFFR